MSISQSQISSLYISLFGRVSESSGSKYWLNLANSKNLSLPDIANAMLKKDAAKEFFAGSIDSNEAFISHIYKNTLNKDANTDKEGKAFWIDKLNNGMDRGTIISELLKASHNLLVNKIIASKYTLRQYKTSLNILCGYK